MAGGLKVVLTGATWPRVRFMSLEGDQKLRPRCKRERETMEHHTFVITSDAGRMRATVDAEGSCDPSQGGPGHGTADGAQRVRRVNPGATLLVAKRIAVTTIAVIFLILFKRFSIFYVLTISTEDPT